MSGISIYKNFGKKIEKIKQIAENSCGCIKNKYNEKQEKLSQRIQAFILRLNINQNVIVFSVHSNMTASRLLFHILIAILFHAAFRPRQCTVKFQLQNLYDTRIKRQKFVRVCTIRIWKFREIFFRETCGCFLKSDFVRERRTTYGKYITGQKKRTA